MPIASVTKPLTAALAVALAREGRLSLDDRLSRWVPDFPNARNITLRQLLNHTSGLFNVDEDEAYNEAVGDRSRAWTPAMVLQYVRKPYGPPGSVWHYSDTNYTLMARAAARERDERRGSAAPTRPRSERHAPRGAGAGGAGAAGHRARL